MDDSLDADDLISDSLTWEDLVIALAILVAAWILGRVLRWLLIRAFRSTSTGDEQVVRFVGRSVSVLVVVMGVIYALMRMGVQVGPLVGALGVGGVALAFAFRDILENFVSGVLLQLRRPFSVGDQVEIDTWSGNVEDITFRNVQLKQFSGERLILPSRTVLQSAIINYTAFDIRRSRVDIGVAYGTDAARAASVMRTAVAAVDLVEELPAPEVFLHELGDNAIIYAVRFWHASRRVEGWQATDAVVTAIYDALNDAGIEIPFPQRVLWNAAAPDAAAPVG